MEKLDNLVRSNEDWLIERVLDYAKKHGYTPYTSTLVEAWRMAIRGTSESILADISCDGEIPGLAAEDTYTDDPVSAFGVLEARRHRERGIPLEMFLGLFKYIRQSYLDLVNGAEMSPEHQSWSTNFLGRSFDRIEIAFVGEWARASDEEKLKELQLRNREMTNEKNRFLTMVESHSDPALLLDADGLVSYLNPAARALAGLPDAQEGTYYRHPGFGEAESWKVPSRPDNPGATEKTPLKEVLPWLEEAWEEYQATNQDSHSVEILEPGEGFRRSFLVNFSTMRDISEKFRGTALFLSETTTQRAMREWLAESEARLGETNRTLQAVLDTIPAGVFWKDVDGAYLGGNSQFAHAAGLESPSEAIGKTDFDLGWGREMAEAYRVDDLTVMDSRKAKLFFEESYPLPDGGTGWVSTSKIPLLGPGGELIGILGAFQDITDRKAAEEKLRASEASLARAQAIASLGSWDWDPETNDVQGSDELYRIFGASRAELPSLQPFMEIVHPEDRERVTQEIGAAAAGLRPYNIAYRIICPDGMEKVLHGEGELIQREDNGKTLLVGTVLDITEKWEAEEALRTREAQLNSLFQASPVGIGVMEHGGVIKELNQACLEITGYSEADFLGRDTRFLHSSEEEFLGIRDRLAAQLMREGKADTEVRIITKGGEEKTLLYSVAPLDPANPTGDQTFVAQDITQRRRAEAELATREAELRSIFRAAPVGIGVIQDHVIQTVNDTFEGLTGYSKSEVIGRDTGHFYSSEEEFQSTMERIQAQAAAEGIVSMELPMIAKSGETKIVHFSRAPIDPTDLSGPWSFVLLDITERKRTEAELRERERQYKDAERIAHLGSWQMEIATGRSVWSDEFCRICGFEPGEVEPTAELGFQLIHPEDRDRAAATVEAAIKHDVPYQIEKRIIRPDGQVRWVQSMGEVSRDDQEQPVTLSGSFLDITERKEAELKLEEYARAQAVLLREVNHRVKNNLSAMVGMLRKEQERAVTIGDNSSVPLLSDLVVRLQSLSTVHTLLTSSSWRPLGLTRLAEEVVKGTLRGLSYEGEVKVEVAQSEEVVDSDQAHHLTLVLNELTTNSVKHALAGREEGQIRIGIARENGTIRVDYEDDGPGFPQELIAGGGDRGNVGFYLIQGISRRSLRGDIELCNDSGALTRITFPAPAPVVPEETDV
jgi:PAS domain S-box-containing protein